MSRRKLSCLTLLPVLVLSCTALAGGPSNPAYFHALNLDGVNCGFVESVAGGGIVAEAANEAVGPNGITPKHAGPPRYEELVLEVGFNMSKPIYEWIQESWKSNGVRRSGSITTAQSPDGTESSTMLVQAQREFKEALITETIIPGMNKTAGSQDPAYLTVKIAPELIRVVNKPAGQIRAPESSPLHAGTESTALRPRNFQLEIDGIDCSQVFAMAAFSVKQAAKADGKELGKLEFPNLRLLVTPAGAQPFYAWHEDLVVKGNKGQDRERNGSLLLLQDTLHGTPKTFVKISFFNLGILRAQPERAVRGARQLSPVEVELYVERMEFQYLADAGATTQTPAATPAPKKVLTPGRSIKK